MKEIIYNNAQSFLYLKPRKFVNFFLIIIIVFFLIIFLLVNIPLKTIIKVNSIIHVYNNNYYAIIKESPNNIKNISSSNQLIIDDKTFNYQVLSISRIMYNKQNKPYQKIKITFLMNPKIKKNNLIIPIKFVLNKEETLLKKIF